MGTCTVFQIPPRRAILPQGFFLDAYARHRGHPRAPTKCARLWREAGVSWRLCLAVQAPRTGKLAGNFASDAHGSRYCACGHLSAPSGTAQGRACIHGDIEAAGRRVKKILVNVQAATTGPACTDYITLRRRCNNDTSKSQACGPRYIQRPRSLVSPPPSRRGLENLTCSRVAHSVLGPRRLFRASDSQRLPGREFAVDDALDNGQHLMEVLEENVRDAFTCTVRVQVVVRAGLLLHEEHVCVARGGHICEGNGMRQSGRLSGDIGFSPAQDDRDIDHAARSVTNRRQKTPAHGVSFRAHVRWELAMVRGRVSRRRD